MTPLRTTRLSGAAFAGMFTYGIVVALLGAILPALSAQLKFGLGEAGYLFLWMNGSMLVCSLMLSRWMDRYGLKLPVTAGPGLAGVGLWLIAVAESYSGLIISAVLLGIAGGALNSATNTLIADLHPDPRRKGAALNLLSVFFGFGALLLPFAVGSLLETLGLARILTIAASLCLLVSLCSLALAFPDPKQTEPLPAGQIRNLLKSPMFVALGVLLFFQAGNEFLLAGYLATYLTSVLHSSIGSASYVLAGYWASLMLARALLSRILLRVLATTLIPVCALLAIASVALLLAAPSLPAAAGGIVLLGFSGAGIWPTTLGVAGTHFAKQSGTVFGLLISIAFTGGVLLPWAMGQIAALANLRLAFLLPLANLVVILLVALRTRVIGRK